MADINYTTLLGLALPETGKLSGQWGNVVNQQLTAFIEDAVAGAVTKNITSGDWTLDVGSDGDPNEARMSALIVTGTPGQPRSIIAPAQNKAYFVINQSDFEVLVRASGTTGASIPDGVASVVVWDGADFVVAGGSMKPEDYFKVENNLVEVVDVVEARLNLGISPFPDVEPTYKANFENNGGVLGARFSYSRATESTYWQDGRLMTAGIDEPVFEDGAWRLECQMTEALTDNTDLSSADVRWTSAAYQDPAVGHAFEFTYQGGSTVGRIDLGGGFPTYPFGNTEPDNLYVFGITVKKTAVTAYVGLATGNSTYIFINTKTGEIIRELTGNEVAGYGYAFVIERGEWFQIIMGSTGYGAQYRQYRLYVSDVPDGSSTLSVPPTLGHKVVIAYPTAKDTLVKRDSLILTTGSAATRAADLSTLDLSNLVTVHQGTIILKAALTNAANEWMLRFVDDSDNGLQIVTQDDGTFTLDAITAGTPTDTTTSDPIDDPEDMHTLAVAWYDGTASLYIDGDKIGDVDCDMTGIEALVFNTAQDCIHRYKWMYVYNQRLSDRYLESL